MKENDPMKRNPFQSKDFDAFVKGHEMGRAKAEQAAAERTEDIWPAIGRALALAHDLEVAVGSENYFTWQLLMNELEAIAAKKPEEKKIKKQTPPDPRNVL